MLVLHVSPKGKSRAPSASSACPLSSTEAVVVKGAALTGDESESRHQEIAVQISRIISEDNRRVENFNINGLQKLGDGDICIYPLTEVTCRPLPCSVVSMVVGDFRRGRR